MKKIALLALRKYLHWKWQKRWNKVILLAFTALIMVGCNLEKATRTDDDYSITRIDDVYYSITVDSCEYIYCKGRLRGHKGNCRFCEKRDSIKWEKRKKEL